VTASTLENAEVTYVGNARLVRHPARWPSTRRDLLATLRNDLAAAGGQQGPETGSLRHHASTRLRPARRGMFREGCLILKLLSWQL
ncbi:MAG: hypothetical protein QM844_04860, partial [Planctomycetota bacterium]|nr:hypothetical protein [Planctomycetota bacterium]